MISQTAEYALRAVTYLAEHFGEAQTSHTIADATRVPPDYLSKVLKSLVNAGVITSQRGLYGGFRLLRAPGELTVMEVVEVVGTLQRYHVCPLDRVHANGPLCPLHKLLDDAMRGIEEAFRHMTIGELVEDSVKGNGSSLCGIRSNDNPIDVQISTTPLPPNAQQKQEAD